MDDATHPEHDGVQIRMHIHKICMLGGTGFVGRHLLNRLTQQGYPVRVLTRHRDAHKDLTVMPTVELAECDVHDRKQLVRQLRGCDAVINLVGILNEGRAAGTFQRAHVELPRKLVEACRETKVRRLLHMSALNADAGRGKSYYLRTKGEGENLVHTAAREDFLVTSFRPSVIFGPEDTFFNRFARLLKWTPWVFPLACPEARFAPVYVGDVAEAFSRALADHDAAGRHYDLCGPDVYTLEELVRYVARLTGRRRIILRLNDLLSRMQARALSLVPGKPMTMDNYRSMRIDAVCRENGLPRLGITPTSIDSVVPVYLARRRLRERYAAFRSNARRG